MAFNKFPTELKSSIVDELSEDKAQLLRCRLVSRDFESLATLRAFKTLNLSRGRGCHAAFTGLFPEQSAVLAHVKEIKFHAEEGMHDVFEADAIEDTIQMFSYLGKFPALQALLLYFNPQYEEGMYEILGNNMSPVRLLQIGIFKSLAELPKNNELGLQELEVDGLLTLPNEGLRHQGIQSFLSRLTVLELQLVTRQDEAFDFSDEDYCAFWGTDLINILTAAQNVDSLCLISDVDTCGFDSRGWNKIHLPRLQNLLLGGIVFTNTEYYKERVGLSHLEGVEDFIIRHANTLERLDLSSCGSCNIEIDDDDDNPRTWATIWKRFEEALPHLRLFNFDPLPGPRIDGDDSEEIFDGYVCMLIESGYIHDFDEAPADVSLDKIAYESLQRTIENRNKDNRTSA